MKRLFLALLTCFLCVGTHTGLLAQATSCSDAIQSPFCSGIAQYPANFDGTGAGAGPQAPAGPNYDCLGTQGNPSYFSLTIDQSGSIDFTLDNTAGVDIDFILWGPFSSISNAAMACDSIGQGGAFGGVTDCSYSALGQEQVTITNAQAGDVYILMVTNFTNTATNIFSTANSGTGSVACPCDIPFTVDTLTAATNQGFLTDTVGGVYQFVVCPNNTLGFSVNAQSNFNDTLGLYTPFTTIDDAFVNTTVLATSPNAPQFDTISIFTLVTPTNDNIGVEDVSIGLQNQLFTGGLTDSSCFDVVDLQIIVPGFRLMDRNVCSGETFTVSLDSIPNTSLGNSNYTWTQLSGPAVTFSSTNSRSTTITIPTFSSTTTGNTIEIEVDYNYGSLCPMKDTMILTFSNAGIQLSAMPDSVCSGQTSQLMVALTDTLNPAICDDYDVVSIPFAPLATTGTAVTTFNPVSATFSADDEGISNGLPVGFGFDFYCNTFDTFYIHTNGFITFDNIPNPSPLLSGSPMPLPGLPENLIALSWQDLDVSNGGSITYFTQGTAPNRQLVVNFNAIKNWLGSTSMTAQAILSEADNSIEIHIASNDLGTSSIGIENGDGTIAHFPAAYPQGQATGTLNNIAYRFSPKTFGPFYTWSNPSSLSASNIAAPIATPNATTIYQVTVTDGGCSYQDSLTLSVLPSLPTPMVNCDSSTLTDIYFSWSDVGVPAGFYEYSVDSGATWINTGTSLNAVLSGLPSNTSYAIWVRANDGSSGLCPLSPVGTNVCGTLNPDCISNPAISISLASTGINCFGDSTCVVATVSGGSGNPMNLTWSTGAMDVDSICDLTAGTYTLVVTDTFSTSGGNPIRVDLYTEAFDAGVAGWSLNVPTGTNGADNNFWEVDSDEAGNPVGSCGSAGGTNQSLHITSAFRPSGGAAYDAGGLCGTLFCPETNMRAESPSFSTIGESNLTLEFNYIANGDGLNDNASVWYNDGSGWQQLVASIKSPICPGGQGEWSRFTATLPSSCENQPNVQVGINWTNNDDGVGTDPSVAIDSVVVFSMSNSSSLISCVDSQQITITAPPALVLTIDSTTAPSCSNSADGAVYTTTTGGTPNYTYNWSNTATTDDITGLNAGTYSITVTDDNGCTATDLASLSIPNPIVLTVDLVTNNSCAGNADGAIGITASGGAGGFTYLWSNTATTEDLLNISEGTYTVTVTDANGCTDTISATVTPTVTLVATPTLVDPTCNGALGQITLAVAGGSGNYIFNWGAASGSTANTVSLAAGTYTTTITDNGNGCTITSTSTLVEPALLLVTLADTTNIGCLDPPNSGAVDINVAGGTLTYSYNWDNSATTEDLSGLGAGNYNVTVTDANGCTATGGPYTITAATSVTASITTLIGTLSCDQQASGELQVTSTGGTGFSFAWSNSSNDSIASNLAAGTYTVTVTNSEGCSDTAQQTIVAPIVPTLNAFVNTPGTNVISVPTGTAVSLNAGSAGFAYLWTSFVNPATGNANIQNPSLDITQANPDPAGDYTYVVTASATTNDTTCTVSDTVLVTVELPFEGIPTAFTPNGDGINDTFRPVMLSDEEVVRFRIYNRWGQEVYNGDEAHGMGWDGTIGGAEQAADTYIYIISFQRASDPTLQERRGEFQLIR